MPCVLTLNAKQRVRNSTTLIGNSLSHLSGPKGNASLQRPVLHLRQQMTAGVLGRTASLQLCMPRNGAEAGCRGQQAEVQWSQQKGTGVLSVCAHAEPPVRDRQQRGGLLSCTGLWTGQCMPTRQQRGASGAHLCEALGCHLVLLVVQLRQAQRSLQLGGDHHITLQVR